MQVITGRQLDAGLAGENKHEYDRHQEMVGPESMLARLLIFVENHDGGEGGTRLVKDASLTAFVLLPHPALQTSFYPTHFHHGGQRQGKRQTDSSSITRMHIKAVYGHHLLT